jgi:phage shock protein A
MKIFSTIKNIVKGKAAEADESLKKSQAVTLGKQAINESETKIDEHRKRIGDFSAKIKVQEKNLGNAEADVKKWTNIATAQAKNNSESGARTALTEKNKAASKVTSLKSEIAKNTTVLNAEKTSLQKLIDKVDQAKNNFDNLSIRKEGAEMRKNQTGIGEDDSCFDALDDLKDQVEESEAQAEAYEEMSEVGNEAAQLEAEYDSGNTGVEDELTKLMNKNNKK